MIRSSAHVTGALFTYFMRSVAAHHPGNAWELRV